jgi:RNA polymerase sigma factor (sigma-70 family)
MSYGPLTHVLRHIRRIALTEAITPPEDAQLLERFLTQHDETAFETLLHRHGPMVLGVCRRLLTDPNDIDDAFQATFLVLIRKAHTLGRRERLANWLYGVAHRTALKARSQAAVRRAKERQVAAMSATDPDQEVLWRDMRPILDDEVRRLPEKYRIPVVLCYLEGKSFDEAARELGWPAGTVSGRLARARDLLRKRLTRRGVTLTAALVGVLLAEKPSPALPPAMLAATLKAARILAANPAATEALSPSATALMEGVIHAMYLSKVKTIAGIMLAAGLLIGTGAGVLAYQQSLIKPPAKGKVLKAAALPRDTDPADAKVKELMKERLETAEAEVEARTMEFKAGKGTLDILFGAYRRLVEAQVDAADKKEDKTAAFQAYTERAKEVERINQERFNAGRIAIQDLAQSKFYHLDSVIRLRRTNPDIEAEPKLEQLLKDQLEAAQTEVDARTKEFQAGRGTLDVMLGGYRRLLEAQLATADKQEDKITALRAYFERAKEAEHVNQERFNAGLILVQDLAEPKYYRLDAEIRLDRAQPNAKVDDKLKELLKERLETAKAELEPRMKAFHEGRGTLDILLGASLRVLQAERELSDKKADQVAALKAHAERMQQFEKVVQGWVDAGRVAIWDLQEVKFYRLEAEIWLARAKS